MGNWTVKGSFTVSL